MTDTPASDFVIRAHGFAQSRFHPRVGESPPQLRTKRIRTPRKYGPRAFMSASLPAQMAAERTDSHRSEARTKAATWSAVRRSLREETADSWKKRASVLANFPYPYSPDGRSRLLHCPWRLPPIYLRLRSTYMKFTLPEVRPFIPIRLFGRLRPPFDGFRRSPHFLPTGRRSAIAWDTAVSSCKQKQLFSPDFGIVAIVQAGRC